MKEIKIEKDVPLPAKETDSELIRVLTRMEIGDSFLLPRDVSINTLRRISERSKVSITFKPAEYGRTRVWKVL